MTTRNYSTPNALTAANVRELRRLGKNLNGYSGETIHIDLVLNECLQAARRHHWTPGVINTSNDVQLITLHRPAPSSSHPRRVYISAGIHGDEPAGPLAVQQLLQENCWPNDVEIWLCPCLNPTGFVANRRENAGGTDLNRQYLQPKAHEIIAHIAWLQEQPKFDLCLCLHEDWESNGFYLYELNPDHAPSLAHAILQRVAEVCPIDHSEVIEGRRAQHGLILPPSEDLQRVDWPEALFLIMHKTRLSYTFEAPSDFPLPLRVNALCAATLSAIAALRQATPTTAVL